MATNNKNTNDLHKDAVNNVFTELSANQDLRLEFSKNGREGYDIKVTLKGNEKPIYLCVVKMKEKTDSKSSPYCAVNANKWDFAINNSAYYYFVIAFEKEDNSYLNTFYSVEEFWQMTYKPKFNLYCHRNMAKVHKSILELASQHPIPQDPNELNRITNSIGKLIDFKNSYEL